MPANVNLGGLRQLGNKIRTWINGDLTREFENAMITEVMPNIMGAIFAEAGIPIATGDSAPVISSGAGNVIAYQEIDLVPKSDNVGTQKFGVFPLVRSGGRLQMLVDSDQQQPSQKPVREAIDKVMTSESLQMNVVGPLLNAVARSKE